MVTREITLTELQFIREVIESLEDATPEHNLTEDVEQALELVNKLINYKEPVDETTEDPAMGC